MELTRTPPQARLPSPGAILALLKPITWFPPMWAYACGAISSGHGFQSRAGFVVLGVILAGPLLCGTSQAVNDWFDRHVDAINEPDRVIPSGRMPGRWGLYIAIIMSVLSLLAAWMLGPLIFPAAVLGLFFAWAYSAPPLRLKQNGWVSNGVCGFSYETLPWLTAAAATTGILPTLPVFLVAILYGAGAHGILTLNDFKAIAGDRAMGISSLPVLHGPQRAAVIACAIMAVPQALVSLLLFYWGLPFYALAIGGLLLLQLACMRRFLRDPVTYAVWYSAIGVGLYVTGMMITAFGLNALSHLQA
ncbi:chlorophyll synthase ChlG [Roseibium denhamense]